MGVASQTVQNPCLHPTPPPPLPPLSLEPLLSSPLPPSLSDSPPAQRLWGLPQTPWPGEGGRERGREKETEREEKEGKVEGEREGGSYHNYDAHVSWSNFP